MAMQTGINIYPLVAVVVVVFAEVLANMLALGNGSIEILKSLWNVSTEWVENVDVEKVKM